MWSWHESGSAWVWMAVMMVVFWSFVVVAAVWVARSLNSSRTGDASIAAPAQSPQEILAERFARGEIDSDEYRRRSDDIEKHARR